MKMGFHSEQLGLRGTEIAMYDYAWYAREMFGITPYIISPATNNLDTLNKFAKEFPVYLYKDFSEVTGWIDQHNIDSIYYIKGGSFDGKIVTNAKNLVHAVFQLHQPHGDKYAYVSEWIAKKMNWPHHVPHMVDIKRHQHNKNLREYLNISENTFVFGYHGGNGSFNIPWVQSTVVDVAKKRHDMYFLFMNVTPFGESLDNIIFLEGSYDMDIKVSFINTCDAMLHARDGGESFGLSIAEFSMLNKPIFTTDWCSGGLCDAAHIEMLGEKVNLYRIDTIQSMLMNIQHIDVAEKDWNAYAIYDPINVMNKFSKEFIQGV
jgi:hypothetical protein